MPFQKGREKTGGRVKGSKNKTTQEIRDALQKVLSNKIEDLETDLATMSEFKQWTILNSVAKFVLPTLNKNDDKVEHSGEININVNFSDDLGISETNSPADEI